MTNEVTTPCADAANDPDDWFIDRSGKQYPDDEFVTQADVDAIREQFPGTPDVVDSTIADLEGERQRAALRRRRHAKDLCFTSCTMRLNCLMLALPEDLLEPVQIEHGTFGGYFSEELRQIDRLRRKTAAEDS